MKDAASQKYCCLRQKSGTSVQVPPSALAHSTSCFADCKPWNVETFPTNFLLLRAEFHRSSFLRYVTFQFYVGFISWPFVGSLFRDRNRFCRIRKMQGHQPLICWLHVHPELCNPFGRNVAFLLLYIVFDVNCGILLIEKRRVFFFKFRTMAYEIEKSV